MIVLDHIFMFARLGGSTTRQRLVSEGFAVGKSTSHKGQGTANDCYFFEDAYLETIWGTDNDELSAPEVRKLGLFQRANWRTTPSSPFGAGLRFREKSTKDRNIPFGHWDYTPPYLGEGQSIKIGGNSLDVSEPLVFLLPFADAPNPNAVNLKHNNGAKKITKVCISIPSKASFSPALMQILELGLLEFLHGDEHLMEIWLEGASGHRVVDLRPDDPLVLHL